MSSLTVDLVGDFVNDLKLEGVITGSSQVSGTTIITTNTTLHLRENITVTINAIDYTVASVVFNESFTINNLITPSIGDLFIIHPLFYFHGTPIATNNLLCEAGDIKKVPMVYLYEMLRETELNIDSAIQREADLRLFFLDNADFESWETTDHYTKRLKGLNSLIDSFINQIREYKSFYMFETDFTRINYTKWGNFRDLKGYSSNIFDAELTGVELAFTLNIKRQNCK